jgi:hypothetical protein
MNRRRLQLLSRTLAERLARVGREYAWDLLSGCSLLLLAVGLWMVYVPLAFIVVGTCGLVLGLCGARLAGR